MIGSSPLGSNYAMTIVEEAWHESNYPVVKSCLKSMVEAYFTHPTRNMFHCTATRLLIEVMNSKSSSVEKLQMREYIEDLNIGIYSPISRNFVLLRVSRESFEGPEKWQDRVYKAQSRKTFSRNSISVFTRCAKKILTSIRTQEASQLSKILLLIPRMEPIFDLPPKLQKLREKMSLDMTKVDDVPDGASVKEGSPSSPDDDDK